MLGDIRYALRIAATQRGFTMLVVLTIALGIGAATATFSIVDTVLLRPLPYKNADRLMSVFMTVPSQRSNLALSQLGPDLPRTLTELNSNVNVGTTETMDALFWKDLADERYRAILINTFAIAAVSLALIGLYGVIFRFVTVRTRELSIRMALGAQPRDIVRFVLRESLLLTSAGITIGIGAAVASGRLLTALLFGVGVTDVNTYVGITALLLAVATLAAYFPARREARSDPMAALRAD